MPTGTKTIRGALKRAWQTLRPRIQPVGGDDRQTAAAIRAQAAEYVTFPDEALRDGAYRLREQVQAGQPVLSPQIIAPAFALVHEAVRRSLGLCFYDVQLLGGLVLARGAIAEMQTGEGKTLAAALPAFLHSLSGLGVHVVTTNPYLAERDYQLLLPVYHLLGASAGLVREGAPGVEKRQAYACDITYAPGYEIGFDYLRDQLALWNRPKPPLGSGFRSLLHGEQPAAVPTVQRGPCCRGRGHAFAIIDEVDSVLIDEAGTPLMLSGAKCHDAGAGSMDELQAGAIRHALALAKQLQMRVDYSLDPMTGRLALTESGARKAHARLQEQHALRLERPWTVYVENALRADCLLQRDVDYVVAGQRVAIVDEFTGRILPERAWRDGLHQAVEAKEGLPLTAENQPLARISRQRYFRLYEQLAGMTGTAAGNEREFWELYRLRVTAIPLHTPCRRIELPTRFFADRSSKFAAIAGEIQGLHAAGRPVLAGSRTIENSESLAGMLRAKGIPFSLLNGKQDQDEAAIVARAGERGAVTIATNMAGRGTDIRLAPGVAELGGLHVIGVERHASARVDRQLAGRAARQGDPGSCRFFVSADDPLIRLHQPRLARRIKKAAYEAGECREGFSSEVSRLQRKVEQLNYAARRRLLAHDGWIEEVLAKVAGKSSVNYEGHA